MHLLVTTLSEKRYTVSVSPKRDVEVVILAVRDWGLRSGRTHVNPSQIKTIEIRKDANDVETEPETTTDEVWV